MKIRTVCCFVDLSFDDFTAADLAIYPSQANEGVSSIDRPNADDENDTYLCTVQNKLKQSTNILDGVQSRLEAHGYEVQTVRVTFTPIENWLVRDAAEANDAIAEFTELTAADNNDNKECIAQVLQTCTSVVLKRLGLLVKELDRYDINFVSLGGCSGDNTWCIPLVPVLLQLSPRLSCSVRMNSSTSNAGTTNNSGINIINPTVTANPKACLLAAAACTSIAHTCGNMGNFRFCATFDCEGSLHGNSPFFPISSFSKGCNVYTSGTHRANSTMSTVVRNGRTGTNGARGADADVCRYGVSIGFENGDLLFIATHAATSLEDARDNLTSTLRQAYLPVQRIVRNACVELSHRDCKDLDLHGKSYNNERNVRNGIARCQGKSVSTESAPEYSLAAIYGNEYGNNKRAVDPNIKRLKTHVAYLGIDGSINPGLGRWSYGIVYITMQGEHRLQ